MHPTIVGPAWLRVALNPSPQSVIRVIRGEIIPSLSSFLAATGGEGVTAEEMADYVWLRPEIEAEIKFAESAKGGLLRHAEFVGLREA